MPQPRFRLALLIALGATLSVPALAVEPVPETPGWRGFVVLAAGSTDVRSNVVVGNSIIEVGNPVIDSINQRPPSDDTLHPLATGEISYTTAGGWQVFFGNSLEDLVTLDAVTQFGVRSNVGDAGTIEIAALASGIQTKAWADPYAEGVRREETDRDANGARLQWGRVMGSAFQLGFTYRDLSFDTERSGQGVVSVACDAACQAALRRDGAQYAFDVSYLYRLGAGRNHLLRPFVRYTVDDRDGGALAGDSYRLQLSYIYLTRAYTIATNVILGGTSRDERNPLYGRRIDSDRFALDTTLFYRLPTASGRWQAVGSVLWGEDDSDVDFHDTRVFMVSLGALYRFGAR
jgi:hypothetical protein